MDEARARIQTTLFMSELVQVGTFRLYPDDPIFADSGPIQEHVIVFPRTGAIITHPGREPIVADPTVVMFYNRGQEYRRGLLSPRGDLCEWFAFDPHVILDAVGRYDPWVTDRYDRPFDLTHGPSDPASYLQQRRVVEHVLRDETPDRLFVEETLLEVLERAVAGAYRLRGRRRRAPHKNVAHRDLAFAVQRLLATRFHERLSLEAIAAEVCYSPYHLSRVFRRVTGTTIHRYLTDLRLRMALEHLPRRAGELTDLALWLGFSSHSHFTQTFRKTYGAPPSEIHDLQSRSRSYIPNALNRARF